MNQNTEHLSPGRTLACSVSRLRRGRGLSLADLGARAGVSKTTVHDIEQGRANPRLETLYALATALGVGLADLLAPAEPVQDWVVRADDGPRVHGEVVHARLLGRVEVSGHVEIYDFSAEEGLQHSQGHAGAVRECLVVHDGSITTGPTAEPVDLAAGDAMLFRAVGDHCYGSTAAGGGRGTLLVIHEDT